MGSIELWCRTVILHPNQTFYNDEIMWKVRGRVPPEYNTYKNADWWPSHLTTELFPPLFQQFYFEVDWEAPAVMFEDDGSGNLRRTPLGPE